jgi:hypothetical protein
MPLRAFGGQQVLARDLGVQQHRRPGRQLETIEEPWNLTRHRAGKLRARCSVTHRARWQATKAGQWQATSP